MMKQTNAYFVNQVSPLPPVNCNIVKKMDVDLEEALNLAGCGKYQVLHCLLMAFILSSALLEMIGSAFVLPAAACDLDISSSLRGLLASVPNIGIILTATLWGRAADKLGRRPVLIVSTAAAGAFGATAAFMPNLIGYALCKFAGSLFLSCPSSLCFAYAGELIPKRRRDLGLLILNSILNLSSTFNPVLAWIILPALWRLDLGLISFRPWRLLTLVYALPLVCSAAFLTQIKESPKFLVTKGKHDKALEILRHIFAKNTGEPAASYPVESLQRPLSDSSSTDSKEELEPRSQDTSALALFRPPHVRWLSLTGFLMFGIFCLLNGLYLFAPDTINKAMNEPSDVNGTICVLINQPNNQTEPGPCNDTISTDTFQIVAITTLVYSIIVMGVSVSPVSKKVILVAMYVIVGLAALVAGLIRIRTVAAISMSALQLTALGIGPLTAYAVDLFPTALRGTAVGLVMMFGRLGSVFGANISGISLEFACNATFYGFAAFMFVCAATSCALPKKSRARSEEDLTAVES